MKKRIILSILFILILGFTLNVTTKAEMPVVTQDVEGLSGEFDFNVTYVFKEDGEPGPEIIDRVYLIPKALPTLTTIAQDDFIIHQFKVGNSPINNNKQFSNTLIYDSQFYNWKLVFEKENGDKSKLILKETNLKSMIFQSNLYEEDSYGVRINITVPGTTQEIKLNDYPAFPNSNSKFKLYLERPGEVEANIHLELSQFIAYSTNKPTIEQVLSNAKVKDAAGQVLNVPIETTYKPSVLRSVGTYTFYYLATVDYQVISKEFTVKYVDHLPPSVTVLKDEIYLRKGATPETVLAIPNLLSITDNIDLIDNINVIVHDSSFTVVDAPGSVWVDLKVEDSSGNSTIVRIDALVITEPPTIAGPDKFIIDVKDFIDSKFIRSHYTATDHYGKDLSASIEIVKDEYIGKGATVGTYEMVLKVMDVANNVTQKIVTIRVVNGLKDYYIVGNTIHVSNARKLTHDDFNEALHYMSNRKLGTVAFSFHFSEYFENYQEVGFESSSEVVGVDQKNSSIPSFYANLVVESADNFGKKHPNPVGKILSTIIIIGAFGLGGFAIYKIVKKGKFKRKRGGW